MGCDRLFPSQAGAVPIIWGAPKEDYEAVVPPHSCIFVDDFAGNMTALADYLHYLDKNATAYREYLQWRLLDVEDMFGGDVRVTGECQLCRIINGINIDSMYSTNRNVESIPPFGRPAEPRIVTSLKEWQYYEEYAAECYRREF